MYVLDKQIRMYLLGVNSKAFGMHVIVMGWPCSETRRQFGALGVYKKPELWSLGWARSVSA